MLKKNLFLFVLLTIALVSCNKEDEPTEQPDPNSPTTVSPVKVELDSLPYATLAEYNFFVGEDISQLEPNNGLLLYEPITQLFTDYAKKSRYVWMPEGASANYVSDFESFNFPEGTVLIKNFFYEKVLPSNDRRVIETRIMFKRDGVWEFADYIWNDEQTEAVFSLDGESKPIEVVLESGETISIDYEIPARSSCVTCHKNFEIPTPNGPKPQNLNNDLQYQEGIMNQLMKWAEMGYLSPDYPAEIESMVDWEDDSESLQDRVRAYLDANCGHCHGDGAHCSYRSIRLTFEENDKDKNLGICVPYDEFIPGQNDLEYILTAGDADRSMLVYRMLSNDVSVQMPLIGKSIVHKEGVELMTEYINSLPEICP